MNPRTLITGFGSVESLTCSGCHSSVLVRFLDMSRARVEGGIVVLSDHPVFHRSAYSRGISIGGASFSFASQNLSRWAEHHVLFCYACAHCGVKHTSWLSGEAPGMPVRLNQN